jgi:hypothetical protein
MKREYVANMCCQQHSSTCQGNSETAGTSAHVYDSNTAAHVSACNNPAHSENAQPLHVELHVTKPLVQLHVSLLRTTSGT